MSNRSVVLLGGPDSGKTNYLARLWIALREPKGLLSATHNPDDIKYVEDAVRHLHQGGFAPRTDQNMVEGFLAIPFASEHAGLSGELVVPDVRGERWETAVASSELASEWMDRLEQATGALIFVRVLSEANIAPLDWVTSGRLMHLAGNDPDASKISTQVSLCEYLRYLELKMKPKEEGAKPRISVVVAAWDLLDEATRNQGPRAYLKKEFPLFDGRIDDCEHFRIACFGVSVLGGDPVADEDFKKRLLASDFRSAGYVQSFRNGTWVEDSDLTLPLAWALGIDAERR